MGTQYKKRILRLLVGLVLSAAGIVMMVQANIGLDPWNIFHQGLSLLSGISFAMMTVIVGVGVILLAVLMGEHIGFGTVINVVGCGVLIDLFLRLNLFPQQQSFFSGLVMMLAGLEILALGTYFYMSSMLGSGPRDTLMVAVARKSGLPVGICRSAIELLVIALGWLMGGKFGIGTVICAVGVGFFLQMNFALFHFKPQSVVQESFSATIHNWRKERSAKE